MSGICAKGCREVELNELIHTKNEDRQGVSLIKKLAVLGYLLCLVDLISWTYPTSAGALGSVKSVRAKFLTASRSWTSNSALHRIVTLRRYVHPISLIDEPTRALSHVSSSLLTVKHTTITLHLACRVASYPFNQVQLYLLCCLLPGSSLPYSHALTYRPR